MNKQTLFEYLQGLELELHQPTCRKDCSRLNVLLHDDFYEIGYSGKTHNKSEVLKRLPEQKSESKIYSQDYSLQDINEHSVLLLYKSAHVLENGDLQRHALRSSLWVYSNGNWQLRFHQGTPISAFVK